MKLNFGLQFEDLYSSEGLSKIDSLFLNYLKEKENNLFHQIINARTEGKKNFSSEELIEISQKLEKFIIEVFSIEKEIKKYRDQRDYSKKLYSIKRNFIHRYSLQKFKKEDLDSQKILEEFSNISPLHKGEDSLFIELLETVESDSEEYEILAKYAAYRIYYGPKSILFSRPEKQDFFNLIPFSRDGNIISGVNRNYSANFKEHAYSESFYCINCHKTGKDSCRKGMVSEGSFKQNPLGNILSGCPLEIKISEMNEVYASSNLISALGIITIDNPMVAFTGHRICNDCSKACIYQKQDPVDIPSIESQILRDVLNLPYGLEIYNLLTMWQVLKPQDFLPGELDEKILIVGLGPAGAALTHYLSRAGCEVTAIDGLKFEKLPKEILTEPIKNFAQIEKIFTQIHPQGFGGVAEYGITDRWDKVNLIIARILLERRRNATLIGGVKFGANLTYRQAKELGFNKIALCCGSGYPNMPLIKNIDATGVRTASDFLMSLNLGCLLSENSNCNFMISLPAIVVGGGLTAIDSAVEITKYYPVLAKKIYKKLHGRDLSFLNILEQRDAKFLIEAGEKYLAEEARALKEKREADLDKITQDLGGVLICYRKGIEQSPAYKINHKELEDALNHKIKILENSEIIEIEKDSEDFCSGVKILTKGQTNIIPAKSLLFAIGTSPLSIYDASSEDLKVDDVFIFGDMDSQYAGSVVKALASAKNGYQKLLTKF